jgi:hypothetical protein
MQDGLTPSMETGFRWPSLTRTTRFLIQPPSLMMEPEDQEWKEPFASFDEPRRMLGPELLAETSFVVR